uniref:Uncharacterized protein n=1 Tax=Ixodes ricinus TaxID=34613 RepID=V5HVF3_IXORI
MRSSDTFQALFAAELVERRPVSFQVAEVKSKFHWMTQEVRSLCLGDLETRARSSESSLASAIDRGFYRTRAGTSNRKSAKF